MKRVPFSIKDKRKGHLFCQKGVQKGKGFDLRAEPPHRKFCRILTPPSSRVSERSYKTINNIRSWWSCCLVCTVNNKKDLNMSCYQLDITIGKLEQKHLTFWWITNTWGLAPIVTQIVLWQIKGTAYLQEQANFSDNDEIY